MKDFAFPSDSHGHQMTSIQSAATALAPEASDTSSPRRGDLDALRSFAMLLGVFLHASLAYFDYPWPVQDANGRHSCSGLRGDSRLSHAAFLSAQRLLLHASVTATGTACPPRATGPADRPSLYAGGRNHPAVGQCRDLSRGCSRIKSQGGQKPSHGRQPSAPTIVRHIRWTGSRAGIRRPSHLQDSPLKLKVFPVAL